MSIADFSLVKKRPLVITRQSQGEWLNGDWVDGAETEITIQANVQPFSDYQVFILPEPDRTKNWLWVFTASELRTKKEGSNGHDGDRFAWNGELYEVMKTQTFSMGVRDHVEAKCARVELTPNSEV